MLERTIKGYKIQNTLGSGLQGKVKLAVHQDSGEYVAVKIIDKSKLGEREMYNLFKEIEAMRRVAHPRVLRLLDLHNDAMYPKKDGSSKPVVLIVLELAKGGELFDFMMYTGHFSEPIARAYFQQLIDGLSACHSKGIYHRDIKPENILLDEQFMLKIADFGLSGLHETAEGNCLAPLYTQCGTRGYMSPEVISGKPYDGSKSDIWSAGVVLFIMLAGFPPFQIADKSDWWFRACALKQYDAFWAAHSRTATFSPGAMALLNRIFRVDPQERISVEEIKTDKWFQANIITHEQLKGELQQRKVMVDASKQKEKMMQQQQKNANQGVTAELNPFDRNVTRSIATHDNDDEIAELVHFTAQHNIHEINNAAKVARYTSFYTTQSAESVLAKAVEALKEMSASIKLNEESQKIKASITSPLGKIDFSIYVRTEGDSFNLVEVCRRNGNMLKFQEMYKVFCAHMEGVICSNKDGKDTPVIESKLVSTDKLGEGGVEEILSDKTEMI